MPSFLCLLASNVLIRLVALQLVPCSRSIPRTRFVRFVKSTVASVSLTSSAGIDLDADEGACNPSSEGGAGYRLPHEYAGTRSALFLAADLSPCAQCLACIGGTDWRKDVEQLTPGRVYDMMRSGFCVESPKPLLNAWAEQTPRVGRPEDQPLHFGRG